MPRRMAVIVAVLVLALGGACVWNHVRTRRGDLPTGQAGAARFMPYVAAARSDFDVARGAGRIYHRRDCPHAAKIARGRLIGWRCEWAARRAGYRPCKACLGAPDPRGKGAIISF